MTKKLSLLFSFMTFAIISSHALVTINSSTFPDENFRNYLLSQSYGEDYVLTDNEIANIVSINVPNKNISNLKGIENFTALIFLNCSNNLLESIDVSKNVALMDLYCSGNNIKSLDLSNNKDLMQLECYNDGLTALNISGCTKLVTLYCYSNQLGSLDVSGCTALANLYCYQNAIKDTKMDSFIESLPSVSGGTLRIINGESEGNLITKSQVTAAKAKGWSPLYYSSSSNTWIEYTDIDFALRGDANGDDEISMSDIMFIVNYLLGTPDPSFNIKAADSNLDGKISMSDALFIASYILKGQFPEESLDVISFDVASKAATRSITDQVEPSCSMFVVEGTKGTETTDAPSSIVVFDNYLVEYTANTAGTTETNTNNWEYVGKQAGIEGLMSSKTWTDLHNTTGAAKLQNIKYWDNTVDQYDFIAWSTGDREAVTTGAVAGSKVNVTRINTGNSLATNGFTLTAASATDLAQCYYTDINTITKESGNYGKPVKLAFRNMAAKVRIALYETVPGYSVRDVKFYTSDTNPIAPTDLGTSTVTDAILFTMGSDKLPQSGTVTVYYPHIGTRNSGAYDYNKASVTVDPDITTSTTQTFGTLTDQYTGREAHEPEGNIYLGRTSPNATFAGDATKNFYTAVIPNTIGKALTLRVDYTLVSIDGSGEVIKVYGAKAVVPSTYTVWQPNYTYTYIFRILDNTNGWASYVTDPQNLFPITFDAVVASDSNAEQTTITTVAIPSITTYQQGHDYYNKDEYSKSQTMGASSDVKDIYIQVMDGGAYPTAVKTDLNGINKSLLYKVSKSNSDYVASEAEVLDALQNRTNSYGDANATGRNGIILAKDATNIDNTVSQIKNGVDNNPIVVTPGSAAKIDIDKLNTGTYAYVYANDVPSTEEKIYNIAADADIEKNYERYYEINPVDITEVSSTSAEFNKVYFVKNVDSNGNLISYTFKHTRVGESVTGLFEATIPNGKATSYTATCFYFDVYNRNNGAYAVKVFKVVD